jgi:hypothetical protein
VKKFSFNWNEDYGESRFGAAGKLKFKALASQLTWSKLQLIKPDILPTSNGPHQFVTDSSR